MRSLFSIRRIFGFKGEKLAELFDDLDLNAVIPKMLQHIQSTVTATNVIWMLKEEFERLNDTAQGLQLFPEQTLHRHLRLRSVKPVSDADIIGVIQKFDKNSAMSQMIRYNDQNYVLSPILNINNGLPIAYVLLTNLKPATVEKERLIVDRDLSHMAKHIGFSLQYWNATKLAFLDDLTGLYNQKYLSMVLENEIDRAQRENLAFSVLFMDVDYFKAVNDTKGHFTGSRLLAEVGRLLKAHIRRSDYAFRYGGDEFVIVLPEVDSVRARLAAERLRGVIEKSDFVIEGEKIKLTLSIGLANYPEHAKSHKEIIKMADKAMYCGKNKSRNIVYVAS